MTTGATEARPSCDLSLSDGVHTVSIILCNAKGERDVDQMRQAGYPRQALRFNPSGSGGASDLEPPYTPVTQEDFSAGRGQELLATNTARFYDCNRADTTRGKLILGPLETYTSGFFTSLTNQARDGDYLLTGPAGSTKLAASPITPGSQIQVRRIRVGIKKQTGATYPITARAHLYSDSSGPNTLLASSDWKTFTTLASAYKNVDFETPQTTLNASTKYWVALEIAAAGTFNVGKHTTATGDAIYTKTTGAWANEVNNQCLVFTLYTVASGYAFFFEHKGALYAVARSDDQTAPTLWLNGYRGKAASNSADLSKLNTALNLSGVDLTGCIARLIAGPGSTEEFPYRTITSNTQTGTNDVITVDKNWKVAHTTSTDFVILGCNTWAEVTGHGLTKPVTDVCSVDGQVYFCQGDAAKIRSFRWTATAHAFYADTTNYAEKLKFFVNNSGKKKLVRCITAKNDVSMASVPDWGANISFGTAINCGSEDERITNLALFGGNGIPMIPYIFKEGSFGSINNEVYAESANSEFASVRSLDNGRAALKHNEYLYFGMLKGMLMRYISGHLDAVGPDLDEGLPAERQGVIRDMVGYGGRFYACIDAGDELEHYSAVLCYNYQGWTEIYRAPGGKRLRKLYIQTLPGKTVQRLWVSEEEDLVWLPLAVDPLKEADYRYTAAGSLVTSWIDLAYVDVNKYFSAIKLITKDCLAGHQTVAVEFQLDNATDADAWTTVGTVETSPTQKLALSATHNTQGKRIRFRLTLSSDDATKTPQVKALVVDTILRQPVKKSWSLTFLLEDYPFDLNGVQDTAATASSQKTQLETWADSESTPAPLLMRHRDGTYDNMYVLIEPPTVQPLEMTITQGNNARKTRLLATMTMIQE
jgi:hypothetical protein